MKKRNRPVNTRILNGNEIKEKDLIVYPCIAMMLSFTYTLRDCLSLAVEIHAY